MNTHLRRGLATFATSALALGALAVSTPAHAATDITPARSASSWLVGNLNAASVLEITSEWGTSPNLGATIDLADALVAVGGQQGVVDRIAAAVESGVSGYAGEGTEIYAGSTGKAAALLLSQELDASTLVERLESTVTASGPAAGRIVDASAYGDYANTLGQAYAVRALSLADSTLAASATDFLLAQQCEAGFFRLDLARGPQDPVTYYAAPDLDVDQSCDAAATPVDPKQSADTTALVVLQTAGLKADADVKAAHQRAASWLKSQQRPDGSFVDPQNGANANTTGLAGWALATLGERAAAEKAAIWLRARQVVDACAPGKLAGEGGAIAYDDLAWTNGAKWGISDPLDRSQWVLADSQALPALLAAPAAGKDAVVLPTFAKAGSTVRATLTGIAAGERACTTGAVTTQLLGTGKATTVALTNLKAGTRTLTLRTATGTVSDSVKVLGKKKLGVKVAAKAKRNSTKKITVTGLAAGEKVTVKVKIGAKKAKTLKVGKAGVKGTLSTKVKVGAKRGIVKVTVQGQYAHRTGAAKVKVQ